MGQGMLPSQAYTPYVYDHVPLPPPPQQQPVLQPGYQSQAPYQPQGMTAQYNTLAALQNLVQQQQQQPQMGHMEHTSPEDLQTVHSLQGGGGLPQYGYQPPPY